MIPRQNIKLRYPEYLRQKDVFALCEELGITRYAARQLIEGKKAPLKRHHLTGRRGHYKRDELLTILA